MDGDLRGAFFSAIHSALGRVLRVGILCLLVGWLGAEIVAHTVGGHVQPTTMTHIVALAFGVILCYAAMLSVVLIEGMRGIARAAVQLDQASAAPAEPLPITRPASAAAPESANTLRDLATAAS